MAVEKNYELKLKTEEAKAQKLAHRFGLKQIQFLLDFHFIQKQIQVIPYSFAKQKSVIPLEETQETLTVAISKPDDLSIIEELRCMTGKKIQTLFAAKEKIEEAIEKCYIKEHEPREEPEEPVPVYKLDSPSREGDGYDLLEQHSDSPVIRMLNAMLIEAVQQGASDIHFEPLEEQLAVRYRIDGVLQLRHTPPKELQNQLLTRIKVISKLDIAEYRRPQDGRIKLNLAGRQIDFRVSTVPVASGERIVLRILDKSNVILGLDQVGMNERILQSFRKYIRRNQGIILVTGPTGSGKTTTLYSAISEVNSSEINIMTIEDPVEYKLQGMAQINVNPKIDLDFATGLRHILRQDPDVIMIGEIRDKETAEIAIQSSLTGHLVLSTLHTNDAPSALTRLVDMGIEPYLLSSSVIAVLAQRLVRKICSFCSESYSPTAQELTELGLHIENFQDKKFFRGKGCSKCYDSGFKGRYGIYELMPVSPKIKQQLLQSADATELYQIAIREGMSSLVQEGASLVQKGLTATSEVLRVAQNIEIS